MGTGCIHSSSGWNALKYGCIALCFWLTVGSIISFIIASGNPDVSPVIGWCFLGSAVLMYLGKNFCNKKEKEYKYMGYRRLPSNVMAKLNEMYMNNIEAFKDPNTPNVQESVSYSHRAPEGKGGSPMTLCLVRSPCSSLLTPAILLSVLFGAYLL